MIGVARYKPDTFTSIQTKNARNKTIQEGWFCVHSPVTVAPLRCNTFKKEKEKQSTDTKIQHKNKGGSNIDSFLALY